jgi:hypothetical protein
MNRRDLLRGAGALAGFVLLDGIYRRHRKIFALGAIPEPQAAPPQSPPIRVFRDGRWDRDFPATSDGLQQALAYVAGPEWRRTGSLLSIPAIYGVVLRPLSLPTLEWTPRSREWIPK